MLDTEGLGKRKWVEKTVPSPETFRDIWFRVQEKRPGFCYFISPLRLYALSAHRPIGARDRAWSGVDEGKLRAVTPVGISLFA
jgi:hypothetical protein